LTGVGGFLPVLAELAPEHRERDAEQHDEERVQRLEPACRGQEAADFAPRVLLREQVHQAAGLLEGRPEDDDEHEDHEDDPDAVTLDLGERVLDATRHRERAMRAGLAPDVADVALREGKLDDDRDQHADAGGQEADAPAIGRVLAERRAHERREERARVDAHVEDHEGAVAARVALRVEVADHRRDVGLEEAVADAHQQQAQVEARRRRGESDAERGQGKGTRGAHGVERCGEQELARRHHESADDDGLALAEPVVGDPSAEYRRQVDEAGVPGIELERLRLGPAEPRVCGVRSGLPRTARGARACRSS
jgi:hypothetical protein